MFVFEEVFTHNSMGLPSLGFPNQAFRPVAEHHMAANCASMREWLCKAEGVGTTVWDVRCQAGLGHPKKSSNKLKEPVSTPFGVHYPPPERRPWTTNTSTIGITAAGLPWKTSWTRSISSWGSQHMCLLMLPLFSSKVKTEPKGFSADWFM